jgi:hypothetical protein
MGLDLLYSHHDHHLLTGAAQQRGRVWGAAFIGRRGQRRAGVAAGAVGGFIADGVSGGQYATKLAKGKSRRWRDGDSGTHKASARLFALWRGSDRDAVAPARGLRGF